MTNLKVEFANYERELKKLNVWSEIEYLEQYWKIILTEERFEKLGRKCFPKKPTEVTEEEITARQYLCYLTSIGFFGDRVTKGYTVVGYIPTQLSCTRPDKEVKIVRHFKVTRQ